MADRFDVLECSIARAQQDVLQPFVQAGELRMHVAELLHEFRKGLNAVPTVPSSGKHCRLYSMKFYTF
jgi:hypothetical protein